MLACEAGKVEVAGWSKGFGKCIIISHGGGVKTTYAHLSKINVTKGQRVVRGQCIGEVGSTGDLHWPASSSWRIGKWQLCRSAERVDQCAVSKIWSKGKGIYVTIRFFVAIPSNIR